jgi:DNA-binding FrmR family transcriptional regulator
MKRNDRESPPPDHAPELRRLRRILGQLEGVGRMIEARRDCAEILAQTKAATRAIRALEAAVLEKHVRTCVREAFDRRDARAVERRIRELVELFKKE